MFQRLHTWLKRSVLVYLAVTGAIVLYTAIFNVAYTTQSVELGKWVAAVWFVSSSVAGCEWLYDDLKEVRGPKKREAGK